MALNCNDDRYFDEPDEATIKQEMFALKAEQFVVLEVDDDNYMQLYIHDDGALQFEYRDGSEARHFESANEYLEFEDVVESFCKYLRNDQSWKNISEWKQVKFD